MRIAVTGGTGYLGAHTVRALLHAGHQVRLLVAPEDHCDALVDRFRALGPVTVVVGDVRVSETIHQLLSGADAVLHAAGIVGTDERRAQAMWDINAHATEMVLTQAIELGLDPVVSVSSYSALFPPPDGIISPDSPTVAGRSAYAKTKAYADRVARRLQNAGAPVVVTYPSSVVGPAFGTAPGVTERGWAPIVRWGWPQGPRRHANDRRARRRRGSSAADGSWSRPTPLRVRGRLLSFDDMVDALEAGLGKRVRRIPMSPGLLLAAGRLADVAGRFVRLADGLSYEAAMLLTAATPTDDSKTLRDLNMTWRDPAAAIIASVQE